MANEATFSVTGYVATPPKGGYTRNGTRTLYMRVGWTPRRFDRRTGEWTDQQTSFVGVTCYRKVAENGAACLRRGDPVVVKGTLTVREYGPDKRVTVDVFAESIGHDLSRGVTIFKKNTEQLEQTALERERAMAAEGRVPLPGDRQDWDRTGQPDAMGPDPEESEYGGPEPDPEENDPAESEHDSGTSYQAELEPGAAGAPAAEGGAAFDDDEARQMMAQAGEPAEPVTVPA
ncbi:MAG TPA: single-stranded DNA-binding protein [Streptosporangiaceae bacterium]|nr:single-stranded DNA-binding protein [Streptosporangiaceae bacterium]